MLPGSDEHGTVSFVVVHIRVWGHVFLCIGKLDKLYNFKHSFNGATLERQKALIQRMNFQPYLQTPGKNPKSRSLNGGSYKVPLVAKGPQIRGSTF